MPATTFPSVALAHTGAIGRGVSIALVAAACCAATGCERESPAPLVPGDHSPPSVSIVSPAQGAWLADTLHVHAEASDDTGLARITLLLDDHPRLVLYAPPWHFQYPCSAVADSQAHRLLLEAADRAGNLATSPPREVFLSPNRSPVVTLEYPHDQRWIARGSPAESLSWSATAADPDEGLLAADRITWWVDGQRLAEMGAQIPAPILDLGEHRVRVVARDRWNRAGAQERTITCFEYPPANTPEEAWAGLVYALRARDAERLWDLSAPELRFLSSGGTPGNPAGALRWDRAQWVECLTAFLQDPLLATWTVESPSPAVERFFIQDTPWAKIELRWFHVCADWAGMPGHGPTLTAARLFWRYRAADGSWVLTAWWDLHESLWAGGRGPSLTALWSR
jgi:hypothetical protein